MSVTVKFECGGCFKEADGTTFLRRHFDSPTGTGYGFGRWRYDTPQDVAPDGWIAFDPYTGCCYCPDCWADIESDDSAPEQEKTHDPHTPTRTLLV